MPENQAQRVQAGISSSVERELRVTRNAHAQGFRVSASGPATTTPEESPSGSTADGTGGD